MRLLLIATACLAWPAQAAGPVQDGERMKAEMKTKMKKPGMKQGEVKKAAEAKARAMKPMLERDERKMEQAAPKR